MKKIIIEISYFEEKEKAIATNLLERMQQFKKESMDAEQAIAVRREELLTLLREYVNALNSDFGYPIWKVDSTNIISTALAFKSRSNYLVARAVFNDGVYRNKPWADFTLTIGLKLKEVIMKGSKDKYLIPTNDLDIWLEDTTTWDGTASKLDLGAITEESRKKVHSICERSYIEWLKKNKL